MNEVRKNFTIRAGTSCHELITTIALRIGNNGKTVIFRLEDNGG